jgi:hypothetical protein
MLIAERIHNLAVALADPPRSQFTLVNVEKIIAAHWHGECPDSIHEALIQVLAGQRQISRKLDELLNPNRQAHGEHCHSEVITMKGVFTVTFTVEPGTAPPLSVASPEDLGQVGGPVQVTALEINGGTPPYNVALDPSSGPLPPGVSIDASGNLTGTPTQAGSFDVIVDVSDSAETSGSQPSAAAAAKAPTPGFGPAHGQ